MNRFVWLLSHDEVNQDLAAGLGAGYGLDLQARFLKEGLPDGDCRALVVDMDSVAPERLALKSLVKELGARPHPYPVAAFGYNLEDDQLAELRAAGIQVFQHGLAPAVFAALAEQTSHALSGAQAQAVEGAQGDVFLVRHPPLRFAELLPGQPDEPVAVAVPQGPHGRIVPGLEAFEQA
jgi:hypothetical protein